MICEHCHHEPTYKAREAQQQPYRGLWQTMVARVDALSSDVPIYRRDLERWLIELWAEQPGAVEAKAVNTTLYGRENEVRG